MASNGNLSTYVLGSRMDEFQNSWEISLDNKISYFNSRLTFILNRHGLSGINVSFEAVDKNTDIVPRIEGCYSVYMYGGKLGMHVPAHFDLPGNTKLFSACKLWFNGNPSYIYTNAGG